VIPDATSLFGRAEERDDLVRFCLDPAPGLRLGEVIRGRRRRGKSFLLRHLCRTVDGVYTLALQQSRALALDRGLLAAQGWDADASVLAIDTRSAPAPDLVQPRL
jgi:hypothetical protein